MKVSVVVPAFNEEKVIAKSLTAIRQACAAFTQRGWTCELIVSDNNSTDRTSEIARSLGACVVFEPINQISRARNKGGFAAEGDWIVFVDADSFPTEKLFAAVADRIQNPKCIGGGCLVKFDERMFLSDLLVAGWNLLSSLFRWAAGSLVFCDAPAFRAIGGFSDKLFASEEIEFCQRLQKLGRQTGRRMIIIRDQRLLTSARKIHLYKKAEHLRFMLKALFFPRRVLFDRAECAPWYDGRR
jgi:glycosyltransferase involved in cell wall biosynthesis